MLTFDRYFCYTGPLNTFCYYSIALILANERESLIILFDIVMRKNTTPLQ